MRVHIRLHDNSILDNLYLRIAVCPFIDCFGVRAIHSGRVVLPEVERATEKGSRCFVEIDQLTHKVGRRLAELTDNE